MNSTAAVLRKIKAMCNGADGCRDCALKGIFCDIVPAHWTDAKIEEMTESIDDYEEEEE